MERPYKTVAIIPARGGSKGLPRKNITELGGVPLIAWSIMAAKQTPSVTKVIVSTEDEEIAAIATSWGAEVPFLRPKELAEDSSPIASVFSYTISKLEQEFDIILAMFPTQPFRTPALLEEAIQLSKTRSIGVCSVSAEVLHRGDLVLADESGYRIALTPNHGLAQRRISVFTISTRFPRNVFQEKGRNHYLALTAAIQGGDTRFLSPDYYYLIEDPVTLTDIDSDADLEHAKKLIASNQVPWTPTDGYIATSPAIQHVTSSNLAVGRFLVIGREDGEEMECRLTTNPISLKPQEVRAELDSDPRFMGQDIMVAVGEARLSSSVWNSDLDTRVPSIQANVDHKFRLGCGFVYPTIAFSYFFLEPSLVQEIGSSVGDVPGQLVEGSIMLDLRSYEVPGAICLARAYDQNLALLSQSSFYHYDGARWVPREGSQSSLAGDKIDISPKGDNLFLSFPDASMALDFQVFQEGVSDPARGFCWFPVELPGILEVDPRNSQWINRLSGKIISGRQDMPSIFRWSGYVFVPKVVSDGSEWNINWGEAKA